MSEGARAPDLTMVKPYADHLGDGLVQLSFTLPVPHSPAARRAAAVPRVATSVKPKLSRSRAMGITAGLS